MAVVVFISGVDDKLAYACRLIRKKQRAGDRVAVFGPSALLGRLDQQLWTDDLQDFVPHLRLRGGESPAPAQAALTPIWLLDEPNASLQCTSAVNLGQQEVDGLLTFERIAEIVSREAEDAQAGRQRWKRYAALGCKIEHHPQSA